MPYRDELEQAHARIAQLEAQLNAVPKTDALPGQNAPQPRASRARFVASLAVALVSTSAFAYWLSVPVKAEVQTRSIPELVHDRARYQGTPTRTHGELVVNTFKRHANPAPGQCLLSFDLRSEAENLSVQTTNCVLPVAFKNDQGTRVTVEGKPQETGVFFATTVLAIRDPAFADGETMPSAAVTGVGQEPD
jgi:cytochrome c-type biogenesis protein CcmE